MLHAEEHFDQRPEHLSLWKDWQVSERTHYSFLAQLDSYYFLRLLSLALKVMFSHFLRTEVGTLPTVLGRLKQASKKNFTWPKHKPTKWQSWAYIPKLLYTPFSDPWKPAVSDTHRLYKAWVLCGTQKQRDTVMHLYFTLYLKHESITC